MSKQQKPATNKKESLATTNTMKNTPARTDEAAAKPAANAQPTQPTETVPSEHPKAKTSSGGTTIKIPGNGMISIAVRGKDGKRRRVATDADVDVSKAELAYLDKVGIPYTRAKRA